MADTFCSMPFMAVDSHHGKFKPCCLYQADHWPRHIPLEHYWNMPQLKQLRRNLASGIKDPGCQACWYLESQGQTSMRQSINQSRCADPNAPPVIRQVKLITGKTCNIACMMCFSTVSSTYHSLWQDQPDWVMPIQRVQELEYDINMDRWIRQHIDQLEYIEVLGGEPLFCKQFLGLMSDLANTDAAKHITVFLLTNGTLITNHMLDIFRRFKKTVFVVSIDGIGAVNEYQRWPSKWNQVQKNLAMLKNSFDISVTPTVTALTVSHLHDLYEYCDKINVQIGALSMVDHWPQLLPKNLPDSIKLQIDSRFAMLAEGEPDSASLTAFIKRWDQQRQISIVDYLPEWRGLI